MPFLPCDSCETRGVRRSIIAYRRNRRCSIVPFSSYRHDRENPVYPRSRTLITLVEVERHELDVAIASRPGEDVRDGRRAATGSASQMWQRRRSRPAIASPPTSFSHRPLDDGRPHVIVRIGCADFYRTGSRASGLREAQLS